MKPKDFSPHRRIEQEYARRIERLISTYLDIEDITPAGVLRAFANLASNPQLLQSIAETISARMITQVKVSNARSWREAARMSSRGREIYEALQKEMQTGTGARVREMVKENSKLISSIPAKMREHVNREISSMEQQGERPELIAQYLKRRIPQLTRSQARLIARTETGKSATALTQARSEDIGIKWYQWATSEDQRVRRSHRIMDKVLVRWDDPPSPEVLAHEKSEGRYAPGNIYNCRCVALPIVSLDEISWPARVYWNGSIRRMTRGQFAELSGIGRRIAA